MCTITTVLETKGDLKVYDWQVTLSWQEVSITVTQQNTYSFL